MIHRILCLIPLVAIAAISGCVERELTINTEPQGAVVLLNDEEIGVSPVIVDFNWYGVYKIQAMKPGYEVLTTHRELEEPWYDHFPFDFFAGVLWPGQIVDEYEWSFDLEPYDPPAREELIEDAMEMKGKAAEDLKAPLPEELAPQESP